MSFIFGYIWLFVLQTTEALPPFYTFAVCAVAISCVIELSSLVIQLVASAFLFVRLRVNNLILTDMNTHFYLKIDRLLVEKRYLLLSNDKCSYWFFKSLISLTCV